MGLIICSQIFLCCYSTVSIAIQTQRERPLFKNHAPNTIHQKQKTTATSSSSKNLVVKILRNETKKNGKKKRSKPQRKINFLERKEKYLKCDLSKNTKPTPLSISQICPKKRVRSLFLYFLTKPLSLSLLASLFFKQCIPHSLSQKIIYFSLNFVFVWSPTKTSPKHTILLTKTE